MKQTDLLEILNHIDPCCLNYQEWCSVGMALKQEGYPVSAWEDWSQKDPNRYHRGECGRKWNSFNGTGTPVTGGTIVLLAKEQGWIPEYDSGHELGWNDQISKEDGIVIDKNWVEGQEIREPENWNPKQELITYLETLFDSTDNVGYVTHSFEKDGKYMPSKGVWDRTAGKLIQQLHQALGDRFCVNVVQYLGTLFGVTLFPKIRGGQP